MVTKQFFDFRAVILCIFSNRIQSAGFVTPNGSSGRAFSITPNFDSSNFDSAKFDLSRNTDRNEKLENAQSPKALALNPTVGADQMGRSFNVESNVSNKSGLNSENRSTSIANVDNIFEKLNLEYGFCGSEGVDAKF